MRLLEHPFSNSDLLKRSAKPSLYVGVTHLWLCSFFLTLAVLIGCYGFILGFSYAEFFLVPFGFLFLKLVVSYFDSKNSRSRAQVIDIDKIRDYARPSFQEVFDAYESCKFSLGFSSASNLSQINALFKQAESAFWIATQQVLAGGADYTAITDLKQMFVDLEILAGLSSFEETVAVVKMEVDLLKFSSHQM